jgi:predicted alpha/beta superfamily hydrolase
MQKILLLLKTSILLSMLPVLVQGQYKVRIVLDTVPDQTISNIYIAGNFNGWSPADPLVALQKGAEGKYSIAFDNSPKMDYEFKFTMGSWQTVECQSNGMDISNRHLSIQSDTVLHFSVAGWKNGKNEPPKHTASRNVQVLDTAFQIPQLQRTRRIWIYLPADYNAGNKKYPVLYMHDGQNLFDAATSFAGEWGVDEALDTLNKPCIVVGIDNGGSHRMQEYNVESDGKFGKGEGKAYLEFIVNTLKPYIDKNYRTLPDAKHTAIAGSSMGGLISFYALLDFPGTFGAAGVFSPSFWLVENKMPADFSVLNGKRLYFYYGELEGKEMGIPTEKVIAKTKTIQHVDVQLSVDEQGRHNEAAWKKTFPAFYRWWVKGLE